MSANTIGNAGEFSLEQVEIIAADSTALDITANVVELDIYEDIESPVLTGRIAFGDPVNYMNTLPIIGQEYIKIKCRTPSLESSNEIIEHLFFAHSIDGVEEVNSSWTVVVMSLVSVEGIINQRKRVDRSLKGTYSDIVKTIVRSDLESTKDIYIEPSAAVKHIIAPDCAPFEILARARTQAVSAEYGSPTYQFYETTEGFHFRSLESLYVQGPSGFYTATSQGGSEKRKAGMPNVISDYQKIREWQISQGRDSLSSAVNGIWSSEVIEHDIFNKKWTKSTYNYHDAYEDEYHMNELSQDDNPSAPIFSSGPVDNDENRVSDYVKKSYLLPVSLKDRNLGTDSHYTNSLGHYPFQGYNPSKWLTRRTSVEQLLDQGILLTMEVDGYTAIHAGEVVNVELPFSAYNKSADKEVSDKWIRGAFVIRNLKHMFIKSSGKHTMILTAFKDSVEKSPEGVPQDPNPQPKEYGKSNQLTPRDFVKREDFY